MSVLQPPTPAQLKPPQESKGLNFQWVTCVVPEWDTPKERRHPPARVTCLSDAKAGWILSYSLRGSAMHLMLQENFKKRLLINVLQHCPIGPGHQILLPVNSEQNLRIVDRFWDHHWESCLSLIRNSAGNKFSQQSLFHGEWTVGNPFS